MSRQGSKALGDSGDGENNHWPVRGPRHVADDGCRSSVVHHYSRAVGGAGAGCRVMAVTPHRWFASGLRNGDDGLEQNKGPVGWTRPGPLTPLTGRRL